MLLENIINETRLNKIREKRKRIMQKTYHKKYFISHIGILFPKFIYLK